MNTDLVVGVSDRSVAALDLLFNNETGLAYLSDRRRIGPEVIDGLKYLGLSGIANLVAAIKTAKRLELGDEDVLITVATDSAALYGSERRKFLAANIPERVRQRERGRDLRTASARRRRQRRSRIDPRRALADIQSRLFHLGRAAGRAARRVRKAPKPKLLAGAAAKPPQFGTISSPSSMRGRGSETVVDPELHRSSTPHHGARPQPAREGHVARRGSGARARRRLGRHRRQHFVTHADGDDLGLDPRRPQGPFLCPQHHLQRG